MNHLCKIDGFLNARIRMVVEVYGMSVRMFITEGARAYRSQAEHPIEEIDAEYLLADKRCDSDKSIEKS